MAIILVAGAVLAGCTTINKDVPPEYAAKPAMAKTETAPAEPKLVGSFTTHISDRDKIDSKGRKLTDPRDIVLQDRKNYYDYNLRDPKDQPTLLFPGKSNGSNAGKPISEMAWEPNSPGNPSKGGQWKMRQGTEYQISNDNPDITVKVYNNGQVDISPERQFSNIP